MTKRSVPRSLPEEMGLRVESTETLGPVDILLVVALLLSGAAWLWVSVAGLERDSVRALDSPLGRLLAATIGVASVVAVIRSVCTARWPFSDNDTNIL